MLALCAVARVAHAGPSRSWFVEGSVAHIFSSEGFQGWDHVPTSGTAWNATLGRQTLPWLAFTGEVELLQVNEVLLGAFIPEDTWTVDAATHAVFMSGVRVGPPLDLGLTPALELATGVGWLRWGDRHVSIFGGQAQTIAGERDVTLAWSAGFRLRYATRPRMLTPEAATRAIIFYERRHSIPMLTLGLGLRY